MKYAYSKKLNSDFAQAIAKTKESLAQEGFGVLTEIDVQETMKEKLGVAYDRYQILGACNPPFAHRALQAEKQIGLLLPCNVIVYEDAGDVIVAAVLPSNAMGMVDNPELSKIAEEVESKLIKAIDNI